MGDYSIILIQSGATEVCSRLQFNEVSPSFKREICADKKTLQHKNVRAGQKVHQLVTENYAIQYSSICTKILPSKYRQYRTLLILCGCVHSIMVQYPLSMSISSCEIYIFERVSERGKGQDFARNHQGSSCPARAINARTPKGEWSQRIQKRRQHKAACGRWSIVWPS